jgi:hypothetical protein
MKKYQAIIIIMIFLVSVASFAVTDERSVRLNSRQKLTGNKIALVMGNGLYTDSPLKNPVNDAKDMREALKKLGFEVIFKANAGRKEMNAAIRDFGEKLLHGDIGLFFYAGHGMQVKGINYMIPVNADIKKEDEVPDEAVSVDSVLRKMESSKNNMNIVILDACRNNPFARSFRGVTRGLNRMDAPDGTLIVYAAKPGQVAADGDGRNGIFTKHFLEKMQVTNLELKDLIMEVSNAVKADTKGEQVPWQEGIMFGRFYFFESNNSNREGTLRDPARMKLPINNSPDPEAETWEAAKRSDDPEIIRDYLSAYPEGKYRTPAELRLKIREKEAAKSNEEREKQLRQQEKDNMSKTLELERMQATEEKHRLEEKKKQIANISKSPASYYQLGLEYKRDLEFTKASEMFAKVMDFKEEYTTEANAQWNLVQKIQRAMPGTATGKQIAIIERVTRADAAALFLEEMKIDVLYKKRKLKTFDTSFKDPEKAAIKATKMTANDIANVPLRTDIESILKLGVRGLENYPDGNFHPAELVTRAAYAIMLEDILIKVTGDNSLATKFIGSTSPFPDLRTDLPYFNAVMVVTSRGIMEAKDMTSGEFVPLNPVSGVDALLMIRKFKEELKFD